MMMRSVIYVLLCVFCVSVAHADFYYHFEDDMVGTVPSYLSGAGTVSDSYGLPGKSYNVNGAGTVYIALGGETHAADGLASGSVEFDVYAASVFSYFQFLLKDENDAYKVNIQFSNGYIQSYNGSSFVAYGSEVFTVGQWHHVKVDFDCVADTYTLTYDGVGLGSRTMLSTAGTKVNALWLDHASGYDIYYDNMIAERPLNTYAYDFDDETPGATSSNVFGEYWDGDGSATAVSSSGTLEMAADGTFLGTFTTAGGVYDDYGHGTLSFDYYYDPTSPDGGDWTVVQLKSSFAGSVIGDVRIYPHNDLIRIWGNGSNYMDTTTAFVDGWNEIEIDFDFSLNTIGGRVNGNVINNGYVTNDAIDGAARTLYIVNYDCTVELDNIVIEQTPRKLPYDLFSDGMVNLGDYAEFADEYMMTSDDIVPWPWDGADNVNYVVSLEGEDVNGDHFCRLGSYEFDGNGNVSVNYWNWNLAEYVSNPDWAWVASDRTIGAFTGSSYTGDATKNVVTLRKFFEGVSNQVSRLATYVQSQRFIDITFADNGDTERWYLSWQDGDSLYKLELIDASYIDTDGSGDSGDFTFESYTVGNVPTAPWGSFGGSITIVTNAEAHSGTQSVFIDDGEILGQEDAEAYTQTTFNFSFKFDSNTVDSGDMWFYVMNGSEVYAKILFSTSGVFHYPDNVATEVVDSVARGGWNDVSLTLDHSSLLLYLSFNGEVVGNGVPMYDSDGSDYTANATKKFYLQSVNALDVYVDDFRPFVGGDYFLGQDPGTGEAARNEAGIATYDGSDSYPETVSGADIGILAAGFAFGSSYPIEQTVDVNEIKKNFTGVEADYGYFAQDANGFGNPFIFNCDTVGVWNDDETVIRYVNPATPPDHNGYLYFTRPAAGNSGKATRRFMYQNSHDFEDDGHIENDPGHMIPGLAIIDSEGEFKGIVGVQFFAAPTSQWTAANYWFELPTGAGSDARNDALRNGVLADIADPNLYEENFDSYADYGYPGDEWNRAGGDMYSYVTATNAYSGKSLKINAASTGYDYAILALPDSMANGRLKFKYRMDPSTSSDNGLGIFARDADGDLGAYYQFTSGYILDKSTNESFTWTLPHGNWYSVELVFDTVNDVTMLYVDDVYVGQTGRMYSSNSDDAVSFTFSYITTSEIKEKLIDDVSISEFYPHDCIESQITGYMLAADFSEDCDVDLEDLMMLVEYWLDE